MSDPTTEWRQQQEASQHRHFVRVGLVILTFQLLVVIILLGRILEAVQS